MLSIEKSSLLFVIFRAIYSLDDPQCPAVRRVTIVELLAFLLSGNYFVSLSMNVKGRRCTALGCVIIVLFLKLVVTANLFFLHLFGGGLAYLVFAVHDHKRYHTETGLSPKFACLNSKASGSGSGLSKEVCVTEFI